MTVVTQLQTRRQAEPAVSAVDLSRSFVLTLRLLVVLFRCSFLEPLVIAAHFYNAGKTARLMNFDLQP